MAQNPQRVPPPIAESEPQEGVLRVIHPIGAPVMRVGRYLPKEPHMDRPEQYITVKTSEVRTSRDGKARAQFKEGTRVDRATAYEYGLTDDATSAGVRPEGEKPDVAENDEPTFPQQRAKGAAPENRAKKAD
jgi:hypothetical protein